MHARSKSNHVGVRRWYWRGGGEGDGEAEDGGHEGEDDGRDEVDDDCSDGDLGAGPGKGEHPCREDPGDPAAMDGRRVGEVGRSDLTTGTNSHVGRGRRGSSTM